MSRYDRYGPSRGSHRRTSLAPASEHPWAMPERRQPVPDTPYSQALMRQVADACRAWEVRLDTRGERIRVTTLSGLEMDFSKDDAGLAAILERIGATA